MSSKNLGPVFYAGEKRNVRRHDVKICLACALALCIDNFRLKKYIFGRCSLSPDSSYRPALRNIAIDGKALFSQFHFSQQQKGIGCNLSKYKRCWTSHYDGQNVCRGIEQIAFVKNMVSFH